MDCWKKVRFYCGMNRKQINHRADEIYSQSAYTMEELDPNFILTADSKLLDAAYEKSMEELEAIK